MVLCGGGITSDSVKLFVNGKPVTSTHTGFPLMHGKNSLTFGFDEHMAFYWMRYAYSTPTGPHLF